MPRRPPLSKAELEIARVLWDLGEATPREVFDAYPNERSVDFTTVQTFLRRLKAKGYLTARRKGRALVYRPSVRPARVVRDTIDQFLDVLFDGKALPLVRQLLQDRRISDAEMNELRAMLDAAEEDENANR